MADSKRSWKETILANPKTFYKDFLAYEAHRGNLRNLLDVIEEIKSGELMQGRALENLGNRGLASIRLNITDRLLIIFYEGYLILQNIALEHDYESKRVFRERDSLDKYIREYFPESENELQKFQVDEGFLQYFRDKFQINTPVKSPIEMNMPAAPHKLQSNKNWDDAIEPDKKLVFFSEKAEQALSNFFQKYTLDVQINDNNPAMLIGQAGTGKTYGLLSLLSFRMIAYPSRHFLVVAQTPERALEIGRIWQDNIGQDEQELPIQFKSVSEVTEQDLNSNEVFIDDAHQIDEVFLSHSLAFDTTYTFNKEASETLEKTNQLKQKFYEATQKPIQVIELNKNHRSSPNVLVFRKKISNLSSIAKGEPIKSFEALEEGGVQWFDLEDNPNLQNIFFVITDNEFINEAKELFPQANVLTAAQAISGHVIMDKVCFYKPLVSERALAVDRALKIQQSASASPKSKKQAELKDSLFFKELVEVLGLVKNEIVMLHAKDDRAKVGQLFQGLEPQKDIPLLIDDKENIVFKPLEPKIEKKLVSVVREVAPLVRQLAEQYSKGNLQSLMTDRKISDYLIQTYQINGASYRIV